MEKIACEEVHLKTTMLTLSHALANYCLPRWYRELTSEVILSTVLGHQVKVQQGEGTELYDHLEAVLNVSTRIRGHLSFFLTIGCT